MILLISPKTIKPSTPISIFYSTWQTYGVIKYFPKPTPTPTFSVFMAPKTTLNKLTKLRRWLDLLSSASMKSPWLFRIRSIKFVMEKRKSINLNFIVICSSTYNQARNHLQKSNRNNSFKLMWSFRLWQTCVRCMRE